jgi:hypothetical protein
MQSGKNFLQFATICLALGYLLFPLCIHAAPRDEALIIDHRCIDISKVPSKYIEQAKASLRIAYGHTSHGSQLVSGMQALQNAKPKLFAFGHNNQGLSLIDRTPKGDLGNPDRTSWAERTREFLKGSGKDRNLIIWSWCGQVSSATQEDIETYLKLMSKLEKEFPEVTFVYMTGHLDGSGKNGNLHQRNQQIRDYCRQKRKVLFDFADIESYDPDGKINYMELNARDTCDYRQGKERRNWAADWLAANPQHKFALPDSAAHTNPLNGAMKGNAFWWMMAKLAGW